MSALPPPAPARDLTEVLSSIGARDGRLIHLERTPARAGHATDWPSWADPDLVAAYRQLGITAPWTHQVAAANALQAGQHTVVATGTGSGKSLAAWLPALSGVLAAQRLNAASTRISQHGRRPTTLYLSPTKALAADQAAALARLVTELELVQRRNDPELPAAALRTVRTGTCDGDTPLPERDWVRAHADVVLSNPDFLHFSLLPGHERWNRFLRSLRYVVVDECHAYRGVLGAHVALVLRRLLRLARRLQAGGPGPVVLCASATAAEPALTAARLIGVTPQEITAITEDGAPHGQRTLALWQPALKDPWDAWGAELAEAGGASAQGRVPVMGTAPAAHMGPESAAHPTPAAEIASRSETVPTPATASSALLADTEDADPAERRSAITEAAELLTDLLTVGARALVFVRSRRSAEVVAEHTRDLLSRSLPALMDSVAAYRGGYLPEERRTLETELRRGRLRALATTNALELGIDVSGLDAVIIAGWPGTRVSLGQQAGRAGRAGSDGVAVLIASDDPLDAYLVHHPQEVFTGPEATVFDPTNPYVLAPHLCAAASEAPLRQADLPLFGLPDSTLLDDLTARGALRRRPTGWFWNTALPGRAQDLTSLRGEGPPDVPIVEASTGTVIGTVDGSRADATVHPGAVYVHQGRVLLVEELTEEAALVRERPALGYRTRAKSESTVRILAQRERQDWDRGVVWAFGSVEVTSQVTGFMRLGPPGWEVLSQHPLELPEHTMPTAAVWWTVPAEQCAAVGVTPERLPGALHAAEHAAIGLLPLLATCDRWDIGGLSTALHPDTLTPTVFVHDGHAGGAGFAERGYRAGRRWLQATLETVEQCSCQAGCPSCVQSPKCGNNNDPLDKPGAVALLQLLLEAAPPDSHPLP
ncbi:ATP-dependent helicase [Actinomyces bovis]|uniref:ATP-dependent helicase n=1 Tax=Actinomyces bovis TaxID=1658 RepID=A0ABY1VSG0_9ACTO|nr:DEAD/DEAH box helicase [Actinomyces bovis]SPT54342.1 ATP-dependent helicase [Actinomyces bovis]VEG56259.1 ATP-dependent helicase [Actinomyces israelii]